MIEVRQTLTASKPPAEVFAFWGDHSNNPQWQKGQRSCTWTSEPPIGVGSTYDQEAALMGRPIVSSFECVEFEADRRIRMVTTKSTIPLDITRVVEPAPGGGTLLTAIIKGGPEGIGRLFDPVMKRMVARNVRKDYERLAELLSGDSAS